MAHKSAWAWPEYPPGPFTFEYRPSQDAQNVKAALSALADLVGKVVPFDISGKPAGLVTVHKVEVAEDQRSALVTVESVNS